MRIDVGLPFNSWGRNSVAAWRPVGPGGPPALAPSPARLSAHVWGRASSSLSRYSGLRPSNADSPTRPPRVSQFNSCEHVTIRS